MCGTSRYTTTGGGGAFPMLSCTLTLVSASAGAARLTAMKTHQAILILMFSPSAMAGSAGRRRAREERGACVGSGPARAVRELLEHSACHAGVHHDSGRTS